MILKRLNINELDSSLKAIGAESSGVKIMKKKGEIFIFLCENLNLQQLHILKQELISVGGDLATPRNAIKCEDMAYNALIIATKSQLLGVVNKCKAQPFGLKKVAELIKSHIESKNNFTPKIMPIINLTPDSFHAASRLDSNKAIKEIENLIENGASLIDIGAASSRPGSDLIESSVEIERLKEVSLYIKNNNLDKLARFSIDTYNHKTAAFALSHGFSIINDVSGFSNEQMFNVARDFDASVILMHSRGTPKDMTKLVNYENLFNEIDNFFESKIEKLRAFNIREIILDIGFGFAKTNEQNLDLVRNLEHFKRFNLELLVGASNKTTIGEITQNTDTNDRLYGTLSLHLIALQNGATIIRAHDFKPHIDMLKIFNALN